VAAVKAAEVVFFGRPRPEEEAFRGDLRGDAVVVVFARLAAGAFLGEADADRFLFPVAEAADDGRLLVPEVTLLGPVAGAEDNEDARFDVLVVLFLAPVDLDVTFLVPFLVPFFVLDFLVVDLRAAAFLGEATALVRVFNSFLPSSAIL